MNPICDIHKGFHDTRNKKIERLLKCNLIIKKLNGILLSWFLLMLFRKKKDDISTSAIDEFLRITESDETACCPTNELSDAPSPFTSSETSVQTSETTFFPSDISCSPNYHDYHLKQI